MHKEHSIASFLAMMVNPFAKNRTKKSMKDAKSHKSNMVGEGFINGGTYVVKSDGIPVHAFVEEQVGDIFSAEEIVQKVPLAVKAAAS